jgi:hypothetical protein
MDTCPACGAPLGEDASVCGSCGAALAEVTASFEPVGEGLAPDEMPGSDDGPLLVVRKGPEVGERFYVDRPELSIGRDPACDIFLNDITVSRRHAVLELAGDEVSVADAGSLNGTYVNGVSVERAQLRTGDALQIGRFQMVFFGGGGV